ncbi:hypothetical protein ACFL0L_03210 [Patescibacteria group bacterium]
MPRHREDPLASRENAKLETYNSVKDIIAKATYLQRDEWQSDVADLFISDLESKFGIIDDEKKGKIRALFDNGRVHLETLLNQTTHIINGDNVVV